MHSSTQIAYFLFIKNFLGTGCFNPNKLLKTVTGWGKVFFSTGEVLTPLHSNPLLKFMLKMVTVPHPYLGSVSTINLSIRWPMGPVLLFKYLVHD